jgi:hypothetical protein
MLATRTVNPDVDRAARQAGFFDHVDAGDPVEPRTPL